MRIAIIGAGISGLTLARILHRKHKVTVFESSSHVGGNARTLTILDRGKTVRVDAGVCIFYSAGYVGFYQLLRRLGIETEVCDIRATVYTASTNYFHSFDLNSPKLSLMQAAMHPKQWWVFSEGRRFMNDALASLRRPMRADITLEHYLEAFNPSDAC